MSAGAADGDGKGGGSRGTTGEEDLILAERMIKAVRKAEALLDPKSERFNLSKISNVFVEWSKAVETTTLSLRPSFASKEVTGVVIKYDVETVPYESRWFSRVSTYKGDVQEELHIKLANDAFFFKPSKSMPTKKKPTARDKIEGWFRLKHQSAEVRAAFAPMVDFATSVFGSSVQSVALWNHDEEDRIDFLALSPGPTKRKLVISFEHGYPAVEEWDDWLGEEEEGEGSV